MNDTDPVTIKTISGGAKEKPAADDTKPKKQDSKENAESTTRRSTNHERN
jgi:hypothetical protein